MPGRLRYRPRLHASMPQACRLDTPPVEVQVDDPAPLVAVA